MAVPTCLLSQGLQVSEPMWVFSNKTMLAEGLEGCMRYSTFPGCGSLPSTVTSPPEKDSALLATSSGVPAPQAAGTAIRIIVFFFPLTMTNPIWNVYKIRQNIAGSATALGLGDPFDSCAFWWDCCFQVGFPLERGRKVAMLSEFSFLQPSVGSPVFRLRGARRAGCLAFCVYL